MHWTIDTGEKGQHGCAVSDLRKVLEAAADHFEKSALDQAGAEPFKRLSADDRADVTKINAATAEGNAAKAKINERMPVVRKQMADCIDGACELAQAYDTNVVASLSGHYKPNGAVPQRLSVQVDSAVPEDA